MDGGNVIWGASRQTLPEGDKILLKVTVFRFTLWDNDDESVVLPPAKRENTVMLNSIIERLNE